MAVDLKPTFGVRRITGGGIVAAVLGLLALLLLNALGLSFLPTLAIAAVLILIAAAAWFVTHDPLRFAEAADDIEVSS